MLAENVFVACVGLFLLSFAHEETAIIAGGYLITQHQMRAELVTLALTLGIIAGDWAIYGLGAAAGRLPRLKRWLASKKVGQSREWLQRRLLLVIVIARLFPGPGILLPVFSSLGLFGVSFPRFALRSAVVAAVYAPVMLYLTVLYGDAFVPRVGWIAWPILLIVPAIGLGGPWARPLRRRVSELVGIAPPDAPGAETMPGDRK
jgi:membrane protein DedA with SNARE-associated domain